MIETEIALALVPRYQGLIKLPVASPILQISLKQLRIVPVHQNLLPVEKNAAYMGRLAQSTSLDGSPEGIPVRHMLGLA